METTGTRPTEIAYLAGFFDGEGCVLYDRIMVDNTNPYLLEKFYLIWGGRIGEKGDATRTEQTRTCYRWHAHGDTARKAARDMMPYLVEKKQQAEILLEVINYPLSSAMREYHLKQLKNLKRIEYGGYTQPT